MSLSVVDTKTKKWTAHMRENYKGQRFLHFLIMTHIQLMYNKSDHLAKRSIFARYLMSSFAYTTPFPPLDPRRHLHMLYICIATFNCPKGILGLGGGGKASKNKLKDASFIFSMTNVTILSIFRTHAQKEYRKVLEMKGTYMINILALLLFENLQRIY